ncbi:uncharacterized protein PITG_11026 [Phytophthora infestans T30-4]|uniref:Uncharacterized protein n=2 Tax=Phytophthora infestans TaxID=4787 RepID=D0NG04_PHYIT|nr:uncharacterized protein PITG_11026 [Phytophthora infestans T30-4]EEY57205.1 hypothetical protein PITG_11026 [Phytophthora infestans T30-4]KAF4046527.1 hypothetical protein GN244_ATG00916 [Phytophthora infestans]KAF4130238.1 hypothetical protein GN958_ATG20653 [Phytophthora infestans]|eukprot:XP_002901815.1 hypothetical protein PITG_11026 [Phytophthora infestans T30-4]
MSKRAESQVAQPSKPSGSKSVEMPRSIRPSHLKASSTQQSRNSKAISSSKSIHSEDDNNSSSDSPHTSAREAEPATDDITSELDGRTDNFQVNTVERQAVAMLKTITKKSERNHHKYDAFRSNISGKDKRIDELHASFEDLASQTADLEVLCNSDVDADTLDKLFMAIPTEQRQLYLSE